MRSKQIVLLSTLLTLGIQSQAKLEAHEWGTFTSLVGSNGITQNGMYHEDEPLPSFVHGFGELRREETALPPRPPVTHPPCHSKACFGQEFLSQNVVTQKMETPVIYFYSDQEQDVSVNVRFPEGVVTETYPGPVRTSPTSLDIQTIANGNSTFSLKVLNSKSGNIPFVSAENIYSHARNVDSNLVRAGAETEKFLFYRGIGRFQPQLGITSKNGDLSLKIPMGAIPQAAFLVHVNESGHGQMLRLSSLKPGQTTFIDRDAIRLLKDHETSGRNLIVSGEQSRGMLVDSLIKSGLRRDESYAMVDTWENGYLKVPGLRLLYILPRNEVDTVLPLQITPAPEALVRSFVGRIEILLDVEEQSILNDILSKGSQFRIESLGRFAEPILRRVSEVYAARTMTTPESLSLLASLVNQAAVGDTSSSTVH